MTADDSGLAERLRVAHADGDRAIARCLELEASAAYWERMAKALKYAYAAHQTTVISRDTLASMDGFELVDTEDSELGERAIRVELVRRGQEQQG